MLSDNRKTQRQAVNILLWVASHTQVRFIEVEGRMMIAKVLGGIRAEEMSVHFHVPISLIHFLLFEENM